MCTDGDITNAIEIYFTHLVGRSLYRLLEEPTETKTAARASILRRGRGVGRGRGRLGTVVPAPHLVDGTADQEEGQGADDVRNVRDGQQEGERQLDDGDQDRDDDGGVDESLEAVLSATLEPGEDIHAESDGADGIEELEKSEACGEHSLILKWWLKKTSIRTPYPYRHRKPPSQVMEGKLPK